MSLVPAWKVTSASLGLRAKTKISALEGLSLILPALAHKTTAWSVRTDSSVQKVSTSHSIAPEAPTAAMGLNCQNLAH